MKIPQDMISGNPPFFGSSSQDVGCFCSHGLLDRVRTGSKGWSLKVVLQLCSAEPKGSTCVYIYRFLCVYICMYIHTV